MTSLYGTLGPFEESQLRKIHEASLTILEKAGAFVAHDQVLEHLADAGYRVDKDRKLVRFQSDRVEQLLTGFSGDLNRRPRGQTLSVSVDSGAQDVYDYDTGQPRPVEMRDLVDAPLVTDALEHIDEAGTLVMVPDMPAQLWDLYNHLLKGTTIDDESLAVDLIVEKGPGGDFLDSDHTLKHMRERFHKPRVFFRRRLSEWLENDGKTTLERAHERVQNILASEPMRYLTPEQENAMDDVIERARRELAPDWSPAWNKLDV